MLMESRPSNISDTRLTAKKAAALVHLLKEELQEELQAYLLLFVELRSLGALAAASFALKECLWDSEKFWRAFTRPGLFPSPAGSGGAPVLRDTFRKWLFHLEGSWAGEFQAFIHEANQSEFGPDFTQLLADSRHIAAGLMPSDGEEEIAMFVTILIELLQGYNPIQLDERGCADALVLKVEARADVFSQDQIQDVVAAYDQSLERALWDQNYEDRDADHDVLDPFLEEAAAEEEFGSTGLELDAEPTSPGTWLEELRGSFDPWARREDHAASVTEEEEAFNWLPGPDQGLRTAQQVT